MINPGDKVICVDDRVYAEQWLGIKEGETFTVSWAGRCRDYMNGDYDGVRLVGVRRPVCPHFGTEDVPFAARRFRPLVAPGTPAKTREVELT